MQRPTYSSHVCIFSTGSSIQVATNGLVSFEYGFTSWVPKTLPLTGSQEGAVIISPFWTDIDLRRGGNIWFQESRDPELLEMAKQDIQKVLGGASVNLIVDWLFIATWKDVVWFGYSAGSSEYVSNIP